MRIRSSKMLRRFHLATWGAYVLGSAAATSSAALSYTVTNLGPGEASSINASGQVGGTSDGDTPFLWTPSSPNGSSGSAKMFGDATGATGFTVSKGINDFGQFAGSDNNP